MEPGDTQVLATLVGARIRALRSARGWSLSSLALRAAIGKGTLSEIESGRRNATLETLYAIAAQLEIGLSELLAGSGGVPPIVRGEAVEATLVAAFTDPGMTTEVYRLRVRPGHEQRSPAHGAGVIEHLLITAGTLRIGTAERTVEIPEGADHRFESAGPHSYAAVGDLPAEAVLVIRHPRAATPEGRTGRP